MTKQQDNTKRDYSKFSKAEAIKEIEKLTGFKLIQEKYFLFISKGSNCMRTKLWINRYEIRLIKGVNSYKPLPCKWLEPLSQLIPILFKNETEQSKTIKEGE